MAAQEYFAVAQTSDVVTPPIAVSGPSTVELRGTLPICSRVVVEQSRDALGQFRSVHTFWSHDHPDRWTQTLNEVGDYELRLRVLDTFGSASITCGVSN